MVSQGWATPSAVAAQTGDISEWWKRLNDPTLDRLVAEALADNLDLELAAARIAEARARRGAVAGRLLPEVSADGSVTRQRLSQSANPAVGAIPGFPRDQTVVDAGIDARWELDLFGGRRRGVEAADARIAQTASEASAVRVSVVAEVARTYLELRSLQGERAATSENAKLAAEVLLLVRLRASEGYSSDADVAAAEADERQLAAQLAVLEGEVEATALAIGILLGKAPEAELALARQVAPLPTLEPFAVGTRADLLRRRPDIVAAERAVSAATADIGVATAELFPKIGFSAAAGFQSLGFGDFGSPASQALSLGGLISWRIFDGGRVRAEIQVEEAQQRQALIQYEQAVLGALNEAEQAVIRYGRSLERLAALQTAAASARRAGNLEQIRFDSGNVGALELLTARRREHEAIAQLNQAERSAALAHVNLYKSLGGGWR